MKLSNTQIRDVVKFPDGKIALVLKVDREVEDATVVYEDGEEKHFDFFFHEEYDQEVEVLGKGKLVSFIELDKP